MYEDNSVFGQNRRRMADLINKGKLVIENQNFKAKREAEHKKHEDAHGVNPDIKMDTSYAAFNEMLKEKQQKENERAARMIGPFMFEENDDADMEVLTSD